MDTYPEPIDIRAIILRLWSKRWWIGGSAFLCAALATGIAFMMTPIYRASVVAVSASTNRSGSGGLSGALGQLGGLASLAGINVGAADGETEEALAVLRSREFTEAFLRDENLMPLLFEGAWDPAAKRWKGNDPKKWPSLAQGYQRFDSGVRLLSRDRKTGLITLQIDWRDPALAAKWANELMTRLNAEMRQRAVVSTNASVGYLEKELAATTVVDTRVAINRLMEAQINQRMIANVTQEYALRVVDRALPPDPKDVLRPNKRLFLVLGFAAGFLLASLVVLAIDALKAPVRAPEA